MRTTINLDDDVLDAVRDRARREKRSAGQVLSDLARRLTGQYAGSEPVENDTFFGFTPLSHRGVAVSNALIDRLREEEND